MPTYRPIPGDRREDYREIIQHAFAIDSGPGADEQAGEPGEEADGEADDGSEEWPPELFDPRGLFDGDTLLSVCKLYYPEVFLRDGYTTIGGLGAVATPPEHRRQGHIRTLIKHTLAEYRENGVTLVALWPFSTSFYRQLGWSVANKFTRYEIPPEQLAFARGFEGEFRRLTPDDWDRLHRIDVGFGGGTSLWMRRSEEWWHERTLSNRGFGGVPYIYGYERDDELRGYVMYTADMDNDEGERRLRISGLAYLDEDAHLALLGFLSNHDSQVETIELWRAQESDLLDYAPEPNELDCTIRSGPMVRLADVPAGLERFPWPETLDGTLTFDVSDSLVEANDGLFEVSVRDGTPAVTGTGSDAAPDADVSVDVATLTQLYVGTYSVDEAERFGECTVEPSVRDALAEAFTPRPVCLQEFF